MIAGTIVGITRLSDRIRLTIQEEGRECHRSVYPVPATAMLRLGDSVWSQSGSLYWMASDNTVKDYRLYRVRKDWDGHVWTLQEAMQGGRTYHSQKNKRKTNVSNA